MMMPKRYMFNDHSSSKRGHGGRRRHFFYGVALVVASISLVVLAESVSADAGIAAAREPVSWAAFGLLIALAGMMLAAHATRHRLRPVFSEEWPSTTGAGAARSHDRFHVPAAAGRPPTADGVIESRDFQRCLRQHWDGCRSQSCFLGLIAVEIDDFGALADTFGQHSLNQRIRSMSRSLGSLIEARGGLLTHTGQQQFLALFANTTPDDMLDVSEDLRSAVEDLCLDRPPTERGVMTVSIGSCFTVPVAEDGVDHFMSTAKHALGRAKQRGGNRVETAMLEDQLLVRS